MEFITVGDVHTDNVLICDDVDVEGANSYIESIANGYGVLASEVLLPVSAPVRRLGVLYAYRTKALSMVGSDPTVNLDGSRSDDLYAQKYSLYKTELGEQLKLLTVKDFTGVISEGSGVGTIPLYRS